MTFVCIWGWYDLGGTEGQGWICGLRCVFKRGGSRWFGAWDFGYLFLFYYIFVHAKTHNTLRRGKMSDTAKFDHEMTEHNGMGVANGNGLSRQITVALSPEQYERLFFQPGAPKKGDLAKRFGMFLMTSRSHGDTVLML